jgi:hypothetical protein
VRDVGDAGGCHGSRKPAVRGAFSVLHFTVSQVAKTLENITCSKEL